MQVPRAQGTGDPYRNSRYQGPKDWGNGNGDSQPRSATRLAVSVQCSQSFTSRLPVVYQSFTQSFTQSFISPLKKKHMRRLQQRKLDII